MTALAVSLAGRDILRSADLATGETEAVLELAAELKLDRYEARLPGRTLGLLFKKPSTRTRVSFAVAIAQLGGAAVPLQAEELQLSRGESLGDTARVLSSYLDAIAIRTFEQQELEEWADAASIPVVNALTDEEHPCQALADVLTIRERFGTTDGLRIAWLGDGTNVCNSLGVAAAALGMQMVAACPAGYEPRDVEVVRDPREAVAGAHVLVTDTWTSMGREADAAKRLHDLSRTGSASRSSGLPTATRSCCTACRPTQAKRSTPPCSTARARRCGRRRKTACTCRRRSWRCCSARQPAR